MIFAVLFIAFLTLWIVEWRQRVRDEKMWSDKYSEMIHSYELRVAEVESKLEVEHEFVEAFIYQSPHLSQEIKDKVIADYKARKPRARMPHEIEQE